MKEWKLSQNLEGTKYQLSIPAEKFEDRQVLAYIQPTCGFDDVKNLIENVPQMRDLIDLGYTLSGYAAASKLENTAEFLEGLYDCIKKYQSQYEKLLEKLEGDKD